ncbi:MAG: hypothetical protein GVY04_02690 [Cyanobacteria bacterium]|nr:hypothetical protein [Cyanobacteria bacterium GSL.Bin1]
MAADDEASQQVWLNAEMGTLRGLHQDAIALESSTLGVSGNGMRLQSLFALSSSLLFALFLSSA